LGLSGMQQVKQAELLQALINQIGGENHGTP
jgi:hypothetical protein